MWAVVGIVAGIWVVLAFIGAVTLGKAMRRHKERPRPDMAPIPPGGDTQDAI